MMKLDLQPLGIIRTPFKTLDGMPIQPSGAKGIKGTVEIYEKYRSGLKDLEGFSHIILLYHFHRSKRFTLSVIPFLDTKPRGLFATRAPNRPNPLGFSVVALETIDKGILHVRNVDILDGTPLLDIKPYVPAFDAPIDVRTGWLEKTGNAVNTKKSDKRFTYFSSLLMP